MLAPLSKGYITRAAAQDPNEGRCLIENCPRERGVESTYALPPELSAKAHIMDSLEYSWKMQRGTLNLATSQNVFFVGASLKRMYEEHKWALMPEDAVIDQFFKKNWGPHPRKSFPELSPPFKYRLIPIRGMENIGITQQEEHPPNSSSSFTTHVYPFKALPLLTSHLQPKFVITALARVVWNITIVPEPQQWALVKEYPLLSRMHRLYSRWVLELPKQAFADLSFVPEALDEVDEADENYPEEDVSDGDSVVTDPCRLVIRIERDVERNAKKRKRSPSLSDLTRQKVREYSKEKGGGWTKESIDSWANECPPPAASSSDAEDPSS
ncbi:hypothetical protein DFP72DRAFT_1169196 [Ephemerocybe angulata]|uniref:HNH nuclease domain-containing protein n=1 Tax=Ephemerocybe angulata TaxID=980116 RepID=A0A8H6I084_9AGAR|nr:hypothetical protein DFP72DRAFT_1169196 [Tulosesus angulatus]